MTMRASKFKGIVLLSVMLTTASSLAREIPPTEWPLERAVVPYLRARRILR